MKKLLACMGIAFSLCLPGTALADGPKSAPAQTAAPVGDSYQLDQTEASMLLIANPDMAPLISNKFLMDAPDKQRDAIKNCIAYFAGTGVFATASVNQNSKTKAADQKLMNAAVTYYGDGYVKAMINYLQAYVRLEVAKKYGRINSCYEYLNGEGGKKTLADIDILDSAYPYMRTHVESFKNLEKFPFALDKLNPTTTEMLRTAMLTNHLTPHLMLKPDVANRLHIFQRYTQYCSEKQFKELESIRGEMAELYEIVLQEQKAARKKIQKTSAYKEDENFRKMVAQEEKFLAVAAEYGGGSFSSTKDPISRLLADWKASSQIQSLMKGERLEKISHSASSGQAPHYYAVISQAYSNLRAALIGCTDKRKEASKGIDTKRYSHYVPVYEPIQFK